MEVMTMRNRNRKKCMLTLPLALAVILALILCACHVDAVESPSAPPSQTPTQGSGTPPANTAGPVFADITRDNYPRVDGSTAAIPLGEALAHEALGLSREACADYAAFSGTTSAYTALMDGNADLLLIYEPAQQTLDDKAARGFAWEMAPIGRDALVFLVNRDNPVTSLTLGQLRDIYAGKTLNWKDLGGEDAEIMAFQRNPTAGSQTLMEKLVMGDTQMAKPPAAFVEATMAGLIRAIASYNNTRQAIGYSVYYYAHNMNPGDGLRLLAVDGVEPTNETIRDGAYPFVNDFYAVIRADEPADSPARTLFEYLTGDSGQALVAREGYVAVR